MERAGQPLNFNIHAIMAIYANFEKLYCTDLLISLVRGLCHQQGAQSSGYETRLVNMESLIFTIFTRPDDPSLPITA